MLIPALVSLSLLQSGPGAPPLGQTVPLETTKTRHLAVQVFINDRGPYRMILDTGAPVSLVSSRVAAEIGLTGAGGPPRPALLGIGQAQLKSLRIGAAEVKNVSAMVLDHPVVQALNQVDPPLEGIIGQTFWARFTMTIDYASNRLTLVPNGFEPPDVTQGLMARLMNPAAPTEKVLAPSGLWGIAVTKTDQEPGVRITRVVPGSPAAIAGLKPGDRLLSLDGRWTEAPAEVWERVAETPAGAVVQAGILRGGRTLRIAIRPRAGF